MEKEKKKENIALFVIISVMLLIALILLIIFTNSQIVGIILGLVIFTPIIYLILSIRFVKPNEKGAVYRFDKHKRDVKSGICIVWFGIEYIVKFPTGVQTIDLLPEEVMIAAKDKVKDKDKGKDKGKDKDKKSQKGEESQPVKVDVRQPFFFETVKKIYEKLGKRKAEEVIKVLFGEEKTFAVEKKEGEEIRKEERKGWQGGLAGDKIAALVREYVSEEIKMLDDAYQMRSGLGEFIFKKLGSELGLTKYGIKWENTIVRDVVARPEIENARADKAKEAIDRDKAQITAQKVEIEAGGQAQAKLKIGNAEADVDFAKLNAKLKIIKASGKVDSIQDAGKLFCILLFGTEIAEKLKEMGELKLFLAPNLQDMLGSIFNGNTSVSPNKLVDAIKNLGGPEKEVLKNEITKLMGGK